MSRTPTEVSLRFGAFELNLTTGELRKDGALLSLPPQPFKILSLLVCHAGQLVSRETIQQQVWGGETFVDFEQGLNFAINKIRAALGDDAETPRYVETLPRRGYRFIAAVEEVAAGHDVPGDRHAEANVVQNKPAPTDKVEDLLRKRRIPKSLDALRRRSQLTKFLVPVLLLALVAALLVGFRYIRARPALTEKDVIVLADFDNRTGEPVFDNTLKEALAIGLEQSPFLNVLPDLRVEQVLKQMERSPGSRITPEVGREICLRSSSKALLTGSIASLGSHYALQFKVTNCQTGDVLGAEQEEAESREKVLQALGHAATALRSKLGESLASVQKYDKPLEEATTSSLEALQEFSEGVRVFQEKGSFDAIPFFERAVQLDPKFVSAFHYLGALHGILGERTLQIENLRRGYELLGRASAREQYSDSGLFYLMVTGELQKAGEQYQLLTQAYPRDFYGHNNLGVVYSLLGQPDKALKEELEAVRVQPDSFVGYSTVSVAYLTLDRVDEARAVINEALSRKIDAPPLHSLLYILAFLKNDAGAMQQELGWAMGKPVDESWALLRESNTQAYYGRLKKAREVSRAAEAAALRDGAKDPAAFIEALAAMREADLGNSAQAQQGTRAALILTVNRDLREVAAATLAGAGSSSGAQRQLDGLNEEYPLDTLAQNYWLPTIHAQIELEAGRAAHALELLESTRSYELTSSFNLASGYVPMHAVYVRGQAYLAAGNGAAAAIEFQKILDHRGLVQNNLIGALAHLYLGRARTLEAQSLQGAAADKARAQARTAYQDFLTLWKDADPDIPILRQAKAEYAKLQ